MMQPPHLSPAVAAGDMLYLSGQLALDPQGRVHGDVEQQTMRCLERLEAVLRDHGLDRTAIVKTGVWLTDQAAFTAFNAAYARFFGDWCPARSTVISGLALAGALVEIDAVAFRMPTPR
jgi:2-iminobutanoate/2-iminopropanoate deaminase